MHCVEALDALQIMLSGVKGFFESRQDANRLYPGTGKRSHPTNPRGVYLLNDPGSIALLDARMPINSGTSGTSSNVMNAWFNLTGQQRLHPDVVRQMGVLLHGYLAGTFLINVMIPKVEEGVRLAVHDPAEYKQLQRTGLCQTHTLGEVFNACWLTDAAQAKGGALSADESSSVIKAAVDKTRILMSDLN